MTHRITLAAVLLLLLCSGPASAQLDPAAQVQEAERIIAAGQLEEGVGRLQSIVAAAPRSFAGRLALGRALDLQGRYGPARKHLEEAVLLAGDDDTRVAALTSLGISYAFEARADEAVRYYQRAFDTRMQADDPAGAAALANAMGRIYLESGTLEKAAEWYTTGYETARKIPGLTTPDRTLWEMRRHHAFGRIAARRGDRAAALKHAGAAKALLDKGMHENQRPFYPYLLGYIAFYARDYRGAVDELSKGDLTDPFVLGLLAQAHAKLGQRQAAAEHYRKVMASSSHSINSAFARPAARKFLR